MNSQQSYIISLLPKMVLVEGDCFFMGSETGDDDEKPVHQVQIQSFEMAAVPVTQALWEAVMGENPAHFQGADRPIERVSWDDVQAFLQKLNQALAENFRLPSEAEWEYAAKGGSLSTPF